MPAAPMAIKYIRSKCTMWPLPLGMSQQVIKHQRDPRRAERDRAPERQRYRENDRDTERQRDRYLHREIYTGSNLQAVADM